MNYYYITGTSRGIGKAIAERILKEADSKVYGISRNSSIRHERYEHITADLSEQPEDVLFYKHKDADKIVLINNAGTLGEVKHIGSIDNKKVKEGYMVNIVAPAILSNNFIRQYKKTDAEKIILNITSGAAQRAMDGWSIYCSSKAALDMLTKVAEREQQIEPSRYPFRIMAVTPSIVDTQMQAEIRQVEQEHFSAKENFIEYKETGALQEPEEVAEKFMKILSGHESYREPVFSIREA